MTEEDVSKDLKEKYDQRVAELKDMNEKKLKKEKESINKLT